MNFKLTEDQAQLQEAVRRLVAGERNHQQLRAVIDGKSPWDENLWAALRDFGVPGILVPEEYSGLGLSMVEVALVAEALGGAAAAVPFLGHVLSIVAILYAGNEEEKSRWLPLLASGEAIGSVAISEGSDMWEPENWRMLPDEGRITGRKINVPNGSIADILVVGLDGGRLGVVETRSGGVSVEPMDGIDLTRPIAAVEFADTAITILDNGPAGAARMCDAAMTLIAVDAFGGSTKVLEMARDYALMREAFGAKIAQFQGVKHQLANMAVEIEPTRGLYWFAAYAFDNRVEQSSYAASLAKAHATEVFLQSARMSVELHGGVGFTWEYDIQIWLKRAMFDFAYWGTPDRVFAKAAALAGW